MPHATWCGEGSKAPGRTKEASRLYVSQENWFPLSLQPLGHVEAFFLCSDMEIVSAVASGNNFVLRLLTTYSKTSVREGYLIHASQTIGLDT